MSSDANDKASKLLALLMTPVTTTLEVILCIRTTGRSERVTGEPKQIIQTQMFLPVGRIDPMKDPNASCLSSLSGVTIALREN